MHWIRSKNLKRLVELSILLAVACPISTGATEPNQWRKCLNTLTDGDVKTDRYIHSAITSREATEYDKALNDKRLWAGISFPEYSELKSGKKSLLSLGEGGSMFVIRYLTVDSEGHATGPHRAVDIAYGSAELPSDFKPFFRDVVRKNPDIFISQLFQEIRLTDGSGHLMKFNEIISSQALSYVLSHEFVAGHYDEIERTILRLVENLAEGGILRSWMHSHLSIEKEFYMYLSKFFAVLKSTGRIRDFGIYEPPKESVELANEFGKAPPNTSFWLKR